MAKKKTTKQLPKDKRPPKLSVVVDAPSGEGKQMQVRTAMSQRAVLEFLREYRGNIGKACTMAGITRVTYYEYLQDPDFAGAVESVREGITDDYIDALNAVALEGRFFPAIKYYLDNHAQGRGFGKEIQAGGEKNNPSVINNTQINLASLPAETLLLLREQLQKVKK